MYYVGELDIGSQNKTMEFIYDTGSDWLWVPINCQSCYWQYSSRFSPSSSTTTTFTGDNDTIFYTDGSYVEGDVMQTSVRLGDSLTIPAMNTLGVKYPNVDFITSWYADGVVGLAPKTTSAYSDLLVQKLYDNGLIDENLFSVKYRERDGDSHILFGGIDDDQFKGDISWIDILSTKFWTFSITDVKYKKKSVGGVVTTGTLVSGTALTYFPTSVFKSLKSQIYEENNNCFGTYTGLIQCSPCRSESELETIQLSNDQFTLEMKPESYVLDEFTHCLLLIDDSGSDSGNIILGDSFLRNYYVVHDLGNSRLGFPIESGSNFSIGLIVLILICCTGLCSCVLIAGFVGFFCYFKKKTSKLTKQLQDNTHSITLPLVL